VLRDQAQDASSGELATQKEIFDRIMKEKDSGEKSGSSSMLGPGSMPGMGGGRGNGAN
jgi:hypothetical protein